jgi:predicted Zn-dependent peptidase
VATAPVEIFLVTDLGLREAVAQVRRHLLWGGRATRIVRPPRVSSVKAARASPRRVVEEDDVVQGKLVLGLRGAIRPGTAAAAAAQTLAGVLGGGSFARLFKIVREVHGLCYYASAGWHRAKGILIIQTGVDPAVAQRARRMILGLTREVAGGVLDEDTHHDYLQAASHRVAAMRDNPRALVGWHQEQTALGLDPSPEAWLESLRAVTPAGVRRAGARLALDTAFYLRPRRAGETGGTPDA